MEHLTFFDLETTGMDVGNDRIVQIAMFRADAGFLAVVGSLDTLVNPGRPIPQDATDVHGITDEDVRTAPTLDDVAPDIHALIDGAVLVGYNNRRFDTLVLDRELRRVGAGGLKRSDDGYAIVHPEIDLYALRRRWEDMTLAGAVARFLQRDHAYAHDAAADASVLIDLYAEMTRSVTGMVGKTVEELVNDSVPDDAVDRDGRFTYVKRDGVDVVVFAFGKHKGKQIIPPGPDFQTVSSYLQWMIRSGGFAPETLAWARRFQSQLIAWSRR